MNVSTWRMRSIGWIASLLVCAGLVMVLAFRVNALRSQVHQSDMKIVALKQETIYLETEFETRANQQQLKAWNDVEFGYVAPTAAQYLDTERQLAAYAKPAEPGAPSPVRVASADDAVAAAAAFPAMVSPLTGKPVDADSAPAGTPAAATGASAKRASVADAGDAPAARGHAGAAVVAAAGLAGLGDRLSTVRHADGTTATIKKPVTKKSDSAASHTRAALALAKKHGGTTTADAKTRAHAKADAGAQASNRHTAKLHPALAQAGHGAMAHKPAGAPVITLALRDAKPEK
ncbi:hypothetical protein [Novosphingobium sp.]|uniref:hypothetical protein n=1 Tax=Novosphingobium sp. TaxID=1874826 RepID=UPI0033417AC5